MTPLVLVLLQAPASPLAIAKEVLAEQKAAFMAKDPDRVARSLASDFTYVDKKGHVAKRAAAIQMFRYSLSTYRKVRKFDEKILSARRTKDGILVMADTYFDVDLLMNNKQGRLTSLTRNESLLVPSGQGWAFRRIRVVDSMLTLPGRSMLDAPSG